MLHGLTDGRITEMVLVYQIKDLWGAFMITYQEKIAKISVRCRANAEPLNGLKKQDASIAAGLTMKFIQEIATNVMSTTIWSSKTRMNTLDVTIGTTA